MTLIAGFHSFGSPTLVGDLMVTASGGTFTHQKKVLLIHDNFALAWTGHLVAAHLVIRTIQSSLSFNNITLESVREVLTHSETSDLGRIEVRLIGWVIDARGQHCFLWNSSYPRELYLQPSHCDGSGELTALASIGTQGLHHESPTDPNQSDEDRRGALSVTTGLMAYEFWGPSTRPHGFGLGYEILQLVNGTHFEYLDNALYIPLACELDERGHYISTTFYPSQTKYKAHGNCSIFHFHNPIAKTQNLYAVPPPNPNPMEYDAVIEDLRQRLLNKTYSFPLESDYYCISLRLRSPVFETSRAHMVMTKHEAAQFSGLNIKIINEGINIEISGEWVEWFYETIRLDTAKGTSQ
jgi:hypothetical protein